MKDDIIEQVRHAVHELEPTAEIILNHALQQKEARLESDWDVLILVDGPMDDKHADRIRNRLHEMEWEFGEVISAIIQNRRGWIGNLQAVPPHKQARQEERDHGKTGRAAMASDGVTIEVLNPRGEIKPPPLLAPTPRVTNLAEKTVGMYWIGKQGGNHFFDVLEEMLKQAYPATILNRYVGRFDVQDEQAATIAKECDAVIYGIGD